MLRYLVLVPAAVLLVLGAEGLFRYAKSRQQIALSCAGFVRSRPASLNVRIEDCEVDHAAATYRLSSGRLQQIFFPARQRGAPTTRPVPIVLAVTDRAALDVAEPAIAPGAPISRQQLTAAMERALAAAGGPVISGTIRGGLPSRLSSPLDVSRLGTPLAPDAVVIDQNRTPGWQLPAAALAAGLLLVVAAVLRRRPWRGAEREDEAAERRVVRERLLTYTAALPVQWLPVGTPEPRPTPPDQPVPVPASTGSSGKTISPAVDPAAERRRLLPGPSTRRFPVPAIMLLNLDATAPLSALETAPPLGRREEVIARVRHALPTITFDEVGRLVLPEKDPDLVCELGRQEIVHTLVVRSAGEHGLDLLAALVAASGWRAYVPKLGRFMAAEELRGLGEPIAPQTAR